MFDSFVTLLLYFYRPWIKDRYMSPDIDAVTKLLQSEKVKVIHICDWNVERDYLMIA